MVNKEEEPIEIVMKIFSLFIYLISIIDFYLFLMRMISGWYLNMLKIEI